MRADNEDMLMTKRAVRIDEPKVSLASQGSRGSYGA